MGGYVIARKNMEQEAPVYIAAGGACKKTACEVNISTAMFVNIYINFHIISTHIVFVSLISFHKRFL